MEDVDDKILDPLNRKGLTRVGIDCCIIKLQQRNVHNSSATLTAAKDGHLSFQTLIFIGIRPTIYSSGLPSFTTTRNRKRLPPL